MRRISGAMRMPRLVLLASALVAAPIEAQPRMTPRQLFEPVVLIGSHASVVAGAPGAIAAASDSATVMRALAACRIGTLPAGALERRVVRPDSASRGEHVVFVVVPIFVPLRTTLYEVAPAETVHDIVSDGVVFVQTR